MSLTSPLLTRGRRTEDTVAHTVAHGRTKKEGGNEGLGILYVHEQEFRTRVNQGDISRGPGDILRSSGRRYLPEEDVFTQPRQVARSKTSSIERSKDTSLRRHLSCEKAISGI